MKATPTGLAWSVVAGSCAVLLAMLADPGNLPRPVRAGVGHAVDGVARVVLWTWDEPPTLLHEVSVELWDIQPSGSVDGTTRHGDTTETVPIEADVVVHPDSA